MAHLDLIETRAAATMETLFWWRRDSARETMPATPLAQRLIALAERAAPTAPRLVDLPGNRLQANAETRRAAAAATAARADLLDPDLLAAIRCERRNALVAVATGLIATAAPATAAVYAAAMHESVALGFAMAGMFAASFALYHAARWALLMRSDELPKLLV
jgi:hypothetical protein